MSCVIHEGRYCPGCLTRYDANFYGDLLNEDADDYRLEILEREHEADCVAYRDYRIGESLRFFARLDAVRAPGSW